MKLFRKILLLCLLCWVGTALAQDVILKKDNTTVLSKVLEVTSTEIKFKKWSNQDGPTYSISRSEVISINYQNGDVDKFIDPVVTTPIPHQSPATYSVVQTPIAQTQLKPEKPKSPYSRGRVQFSLNGGVAIPVGKFGTTNNITNLDDYCAPFSMFAEFLGTADEVGVGAAKTGFIGSMKLHVPCYENGRSIIGIPMKFNVLYHGISDSEKQAYRPLWEVFISNEFNAEYGVNAYQLNISKFSSYLNFSILTGIDYTYYINKPFALFAEGNIGLNISHVTSTQMRNSLAGTYISTYQFYSEEELSVKYKTKASFAYEMGVGMILFDHFSLGAFYSSCVPVQLTCAITRFSDEGTVKKLQPSVISIQLGVLF